MKSNKINYINKISKSNENMGISLIVLVITIVVGIILTSTIIINVNGALSSSGQTAFATDLLKVEDGVKVYYTQNQTLPTQAERFPVIEGTTSMTQAELLSKVDTKLSTKFINELTENSDYNSSDDNTGEFYEVDLSKIDITKTARGTKKSGQNDVYVVSTSTMKVYYLKGAQYGKVTYFSLTSSLSSVTNVKPNDVTYNVNTVAGVTVKKLYNVWTNRMGVKIEAAISGSEELYIGIPDQTGNETQKKITTQVGFNSFNFDNLQDIVNNKANITVSNLTIQDANSFDALAQQQKYINVIKKSGTNEIGKIKIDLSNYENVAPTYLGDAKVISGVDQNVIEFTVSDSISKIGEVKYDYLKEFDSDGNLINSNNVTTFDSNYLMTKGKKGTYISKDESNNYKYQITLPKKVQTVEILVLDNAKNWIKFDVANTSSPLYLGVTPQILSLSRAKFKLALNSSAGVSNVKTYFSINDGDYSNEKIYTLNSNNTVNTITCDDYKNIAGATQNLNIKIVATDNKSSNNNVETVVLRFKSGDAEIHGAKIGEITSENTTINGDAPSYNNPVIPDGFKTVNTAGANWGDDISSPTDWNNGLVIEDKNGNQFVWVPVDGTNVIYQKDFTFGSSYLATEFNTSDDTTPTGFNITNITNIYKGFYIGRYESMFEYVDGVARVAVKKNTNKSDNTDWSTARNVQHNGYLFNYINYTDAKTYSELMASTYNYVSNKVGTNLVTGAQWDTVMKWIQNTGTNVLDSRAWGNYSNPISPANLDGYASLQPSGYGEYWKAKNIYDLAGNTWEWTSENNSTNSIVRGGAFDSDASNYGASYRNSQNTTQLSKDKTFRVGLYIK